MGIIKTVIVALSMFSRIPTPYVEWDEKNMRYMLCAFPLIGIFIGLLLCVWIWIVGLLGFGKILCAAGITLIPVLVTGGIHLDGFCDTVDALSSRSGQEQKREILKDPHTGAFAVIGVCAYMIAYFALATELNAGYATAICLGLMHVLSRSLSGISVISFPESPSKGLFSFFKVSSDKKRAAAILFLIFAAASACLIWFFLPSGAVMVLAALLCMLCLWAMSKKQFGGMSGDLAGWFLQTAELTMLAVYIFMEKVVMI